MSETRLKPSNAVSERVFANGHWLTEDALHQVLIWCQFLWAAHLHFDTRHMILKHDCSGVHLVKVIFSECAWTCMHFTCARFALKADGKGMSLRVKSFSYSRQPAFAFERSGRCCDAYACLDLHNMIVL